MKIIMLKGLPCSLKSSWAKEKALEGNYVIISKDEIRKMFGGEWTSRKEKDVLYIRNNLIRTAIQLKKNVIVDDTNLNPKHERYLRQLAKELGARFEINDSFLNETPEACIKRDLHRGDKAVGASVIWDMYFRWVAPQPVKELNQHFDKPRAILCDLDGTLALTLEGRSFYDMERVDEDTLDPFMGCVIDALSNYGAEPSGKPYPSIILISGRNECAREKTYKWLEKNMVPYTKLLMRADGDTRPDEVVKRELYEKYIEPEYAVLGIFDDRPQCVRLWQSLGLRVANLGQWGVEF